MDGNFYMCIQICCKYASIWIFFLWKYQNIIHIQIEILITEWNIKNSQFTFKAIPYQFHDINVVGIEFTYYKNTHTMLQHWHHWKKNDNSINIFVKWKFCKNNYFHLRKKSTKKYQNMFPINFVSTFEKLVPFEINIWA